MGIDTKLAVLDEPITTDMVEREAATYAEFVEHLEGRDDAPMLARYRAVKESIDEMGRLLDDFEEPPSENELDLDTLMYGLYGYPFFRPGHFVWFSLIRNSIVTRSKVPQFLARESTEAAGLWCKLVGRWDGCSEYAGMEPPFEYHVDGTTYHIHSTRGGGFLQGEELVRLAEELRPRLSETEAFYSSLEGNYSHHAENATPVELVFSLCSLYGNSETDTAIFSLYG